MIRFRVSCGCVTWYCEDCGSHGWAAGTEAESQAHRDADAHACAPRININPEEAARALASVNETIRAAYALEREGPDPAREILAVISEPLGLCGDGLPGYGKPGKDCCAMCLGPHRGGGLCVYCGSLKAMTDPPAKYAACSGAARRRLTPVLGLLIVLAGWAFLAFYATAGVKP